MVWFEAESHYHHKLLLIQSGNKQTQITIITKQSQLSSVHWDPSWYFAGSIELCRTLKLRPSPVSEPGCYISMDTSFETLWMKEWCLWRKPEAVHSSYRQNQSTVVPVRLHQAGVDLSAWKREIQPEKCLITYEWDVGFNLRPWLLQGAHLYLTALRHSRQK